jgi:hypothetical protein
MVMMEAFLAGDDEICHPTKIEVESSITSVVPGLQPSNATCFAICPFPQLRPFSDDRMIGA